MRRWRGWAVNFGLTGASILVFLGLCELIVFRFVWFASDVPANVFVDGLVRYAPNQRGVWRVRDEIAAPYRINAQGWNSGSGDYAVARRPGIPRVAIVGDSFVEALQVPHNRSFGERLADEFGASRRPVEVYRFGISGAPLSQYLFMTEREVARYRPDWVIVLIVHNDFDESYKFNAGRYTSSFLKLHVEDGRVTSEIPPQRWEPGAVEWLRRTATARFFLYRWQLRPELLLDFALPRAHAAARYAANTEIAAVLADRRGVEAITDYLFGRLDAVVRAMGARLLMAMDGDRFAIYQGIDSLALDLNRIAAAAALQRHIPFVDLQPAFAADWQATHHRFDFDADGHWNEHGHEVAAAAIGQALRSLSHQFEPD